MSIVTEIVEPVHRSSWMSPSQCLNFYKVPYKIRELQIHWWDDPKKKPTHTSTVNFIKNKTGGSVNYVVSANRVTAMVTEDNCAITTQNGNPYGIKLECSPYGTDADYATIGRLVADIWKRRGILPLVPHSKYWNTVCPGTLSLPRIAQEANKYMEDDVTKVTKELFDIILPLAQGNVGTDQEYQEGLKFWVGKPLEDFIKSLPNAPAVQRYQAGVERAIAYVAATRAVTVD